VVEDVYIDLSEGFIEVERGGHPGQYILTAETLTELSLGPHRQHLVIVPVKYPIWPDPGLIDEIENVIKPHHSGLGPAMPSNAVIYWHHLDISVICPVVPYDILYTARGPIGY
jgi:hypothetical protein